MTTIISEAQLYLNSNCKYSYKQFMIHVYQNMHIHFSPPNVSDRYRGAYI